MADPRIVWRLSATDEVSKKLGAIDSRLGGLSKSFASLGRLAIGGGIAAITVGLVRAVKASLDWADKLDDLSKRTGIAASALQVYEFAAEQTGTSIDTLTSAVVKLARANDAARLGSSEAATAFQRLGIDAAKLATLPLDKRLLVVADALSKVDDAGTELAIGWTILGKSFAEIRPLLADGAAGLRAYGIEAEKIGALTDEQIKTLGDANDAWDRLGKSAKNLGAVLLATTGPALSNVADFLTDGVASGAKVARNAIDDLTRSWKAFNEGRLFVGEIVEPLARGPQGRRTQDVTTGPRITVSDDPQAIARVTARITTDIEAMRRIVSEEITVPEPSVDDAIAAWDRLAKASKDAAAESAADIARIIEQTRTPLESYRASIARVEELMRAGLSAEVAAREIGRLGSVLGEQTQAMVDATQAGREWAESQSQAADIIAGIEAPIDRAAAAYRRIAELQAKGLLSPEQAAAAKAKEIDDLVGKVETAAVTVDDRTRGLLEDIKNATEGIAGDITDIFFDTTKSIGDMFADVFNRIARMAVEKQIVQPFVDMIGGALGGLFGGGGLDLIDLSKLPTRRASGGPVTGGRPYLVGEEGPELFMPRQSGQIVPNGASVGGTALNVTFNVNSLDPRSAAQVIAENERVIVNVIRRAQNRAGYGATV